jgi:hypothetical protein
MNKIKLTVVIGLALVLVGALFSMQRGAALAAPQLQMTPAVDPMSMPTSEAPASQLGEALAAPTMAAGQVTCPMMDGTMTGMSGMDMSQMGSMPMGSMGGMSMGSQMGGMPMGSMMGSMDMSQMGGMSMGSMGSMPMGSMGDMSMGGMQNMNDVLSTRTWAGGFFALNPWWILGWMVLFGLVLCLLVLGIVLLTRTLRREKPVTAG